MREEADVGLEPVLCKGIFRPSIKFPQRNTFSLPLDAAFASLFYFKALASLFRYSLYLLMHKAGIYFWNTDLYSKHKSII